MTNGSRCARTGRTSYRQWWTRYWSTPRSIRSGSSWSVGRSVGHRAPRCVGGAATRGAVVDPGQYDIGADVMTRLGPLAQRLDDPTADPMFQACSTTLPWQRFWPPNG